MKSIARMSLLVFVGLAAVRGDAVAASQPAPVIERLLGQIEQDGRIGVAGETVSRSATLFELYRRRAFEPMWSARGNVAGLVDAIHDGEAQGLDARDYHYDAIAGRARGSGNPAFDAAARDLLMTDALVRLAHDVRFGAAPPDPPGPDLLPASLDDAEDAAAVLQQAVDQQRVREFVASLEPRSSTYERLKQALATYREIRAAGGWRTIAAGPPLQPGQRDPRVAALRERLAVTGDLRRSWMRKPGDVYDDELRDGLRAFQSRHGLATDGALGTRTLAALNVPVEARINQIRASLERSRWFLHDLPERYVMVNVAAFGVQFVENDRVIWRSRVIVGDRDKETPMFRADMQSVVLNPTWSVPDSIVRNELLPGLRKDPRYLARRHIVRTGDDYVQAAGKDNALGRIKMLFPNPYSVYMHDTPTKSLFDRTTRTFSHGCVRVENPVELAALALDDPAWSVAALNRAIARGQTRWITLRNPVPVLVLYSSVTVGRDGTVEFLPDIYDRDQEILRALGHDSRATRPQPPASV